MSETAIIKFDVGELSPRVRGKLLNMLQCHCIKAIDLVRMRGWSQSNPAAPKGQWHISFTSFIVIGEGYQVTDIQLPPPGVKLIPPDQEYAAADMIAALESQTVWTAKELAEFFKCSSEEINKLGRQGRLPSYPITSGLRRYSGRKLAGHLENVEQGGLARSGKSGGPKRP
jgi:hypothetical protein